MAAQQVETENGTADESVTVTQMEAPVVTVVSVPVVSVPALNVWPGNKPLAVYVLAPTPPVVVATKLSGVGKMDPPISPMYGGVAGHVRASLATTVNVQQRDAVASAASVTFKHTE